MSILFTIKGTKERSSSAVDDMFDLDPFTYDEESQPSQDDDLFSDDESTPIPNYKSRSSEQSVIIFFFRKHCGVCKTV